MRRISLPGAAIALWTLAAGAWLAPLATGYFLSDDFVIFAMFGEAEQKQRLLASALAKFTEGLDVATSRFYRPLPHLSFAACYALFGANAKPWLLVNLAAHLSTAVLVAVLAMRLRADRSWRSVLGAVTGATVFLAFAPGLEAAAWVAARYDAFATFFSMAACVAFLERRRRWDVASGVSLVAFALALLSKESAAIVPPAIVVLSIWGRRDDALAPARRIAAALTDTWPWLLLAAAYLVLRAILFGSAWEVYAGSSPELFAVLPGRWEALATSIAPWGQAQFPGTGGGLALAVLLALTSATAIALSDRRAAAGALAALALAVGSVLVVAPHLGGLPPDGSGGRLFHMTGATLGVLVGVAGASTALRGAATVLAVFLAVAAVITGSEARGRWMESHLAMRNIAAGLHRLHATLGPDEHALVVIAPARGHIPFGLNAQAGLMLPPVQVRPVSDRLLVQTADELSGTSEGYGHGLIANLRRFPILDPRVKAADGPPEFPTQVFCWPNSGRALVRVPVGPHSASNAWLDEVRETLARSDCATGSRG